MTARGVARFAALAGAAVLLGGCYTVLQAPYISPVSSVAVPAQESHDSGEGSAGDYDYLAPQAGYYHSGDTYGQGFYERDGYDDFLGYGYSAYNAGYGLYRYGAPVSPYYGYSGYYSGYGPYGYGYDPYYYGSGGTYVPPGYQLITTGELERLRDDSQLLHTTKPAGPSQQDLERRRLEAAQRAEQAWTRRVDTRERKAPQPTVRTAPSKTTSSTGSATSGTSKPASTQSSGSKTAKERKKRR